MRGVERAIAVRTDASHRRISTIVSAFANGAMTHPHSVARVRNRVLEGIGACGQIPGTITR
jgi:hypothetical protein